MVNSTITDDTYTKEKVTTKEKLGKATREIVGVSKTSW